MTSFQRTIKYLAIAFGVFLTINIISAILFGLTSFFGIFLEDTAGYSEKNQDYHFSQTYEQTQINELDIDISQAKLRIVEGEELKVEAKNTSNQFGVEQKGETLKIKEEKVRFFFGGYNETAEIVVTIPKEMTFEKIQLETGISDSRIDELRTKELKLKLGVGNVTIQSIEAQKAKIETGVGRTQIDQATISDLDLEAGVGEVLLTGKLTGNNRVKCGVGRLVLELLGEKKDYTIRAETGIGSILVDNKKVEEGSYGTGENTIRVEGGVGAVEVAFSQTTEAEKDSKQEESEVIELHQDNNQIVNSIEM